MTFSLGDSATAPRLVENCLRDFYNYLKSVQLEQLGAGGSTIGSQHSGRDSTDSSLENGSAGPTSREYTIGDHLCYSAPQHQLQQVWDKKGLKSYIKQLKYYGNLLKKQRDRFPTDHDNKLLVDIFTIIQTVVQQKQQESSFSSSNDTANQTVAPLLELVSQLLTSVQVIDLDRLIELLHKNHVAGEAMQDQDVVVFLGAAGSGKTTCLHYLAGTMFEETEVDGFCHMQPKCVADPILASYETSSGRDTVTRTLQTAQIEYHGHTLVLCDTPSLTDAEGFEEDIAHGLGLVRAIQRAKTVRPVLVVSRDGMGGRGKNSVLSETLSSLAILMGGGDDGDDNTTIDFQPFQYVFTKYEEQHKTAIHKQFQAIWKQPHAEPGKVGLVRSCVDCIVQKTTPYANIVLPLAQKPVHLLNTLVLPTQPVVENPRDTFQVFASTDALEKLDAQLQITLGDMTQALVRADYATALYRLKQMKDLAKFLPEAGEYSQLGVSGMLRHVSVLQEQTATALRRNDFDQVSDKLRFLYMFTREVPEALSSAQKGLEMAVQHVIVPRENILQILEEIRVAEDDNQFTTLLTQLKSNMEAVIRSEVLRAEIRSIQERILYSDPAESGNAELVDIPCMPQRSGKAFCEDQVTSLTDILMADIPDFQVDWVNIDGLISNRQAFLVALARLKEVGSVLQNSQGGDRAIDVCDQAFSKFYNVVDKVLSREEKTCQSTKDLKVFEQQAWFLTLLKEASEIYESSAEGARSHLLYQQAFHKFYGVVEHVLSNAETNFLASSNDLEAFERQARFLALLRDASEVLQDSPGGARAASVYEQAFTLFYAVVASVLSEAEKSFQSKDRSLLALEKQARFLALLKNISAILVNSPGSERAAAAYKHASGQFHILIGNMLSGVEENYLSDGQDWDAMESTCWFLALLIQGKLKYKPDSGSEEEKQVKALEQRLLTLMLRTELEVTDTMKLIREKKILTFIKNCGSAKEEVMTEIQFLNLIELDARRKLLVSIVDKPKVRKLLPSRIEPSEVLDSLAHLDKQLAKFFAGQVLSAVQEYNMVVELQKKGKKLLVTKQIALSLRSNIIMAKEDFATVRSWSKELAAKTESNWRRLGALKKCVDLGIIKLDKIIAKEPGPYEFSCGIPGTAAFLSFCRS